jgi:hypothetical protein
MAPLIEHTAPEVSMSAVGNLQTSIQEASAGLTLAELLATELLNSHPGET